MAESKTIDLRCDTCGAIVTLLVADVGQQGFAVGNPRGLVCPFDQHYDDHAHHGELTRVAPADAAEAANDGGDDAGNRAQTSCRWCDAVLEGDDAGIGGEWQMCFDCFEERDRFACAALEGMLASGVGVSIGAAGSRSNRADIAYAFADDMLRARRKAPPP